MSLTFASTVHLIQHMFTKVNESPVAYIEVGDTIEFVRNAGGVQQAVVTYIAPSGRIDYEYQYAAGTERWYTTAEKVIGLVKQSSGAAHGSAAQVIAGRRLSNGKAA